MDLYVLALSPHANKKITNVIRHDSILYGQETINLNSASTIEFATNIEVSKTLKVGDLVHYYKHSNFGGSVVYRILKKNIEGAVCTFFGIEESYYCVEKQAPLSEMRFNNQNPRYVIEKIIKGEKYDNAGEIKMYGYYGNGSQTSNFSGTFCNQTRLSALNEISEKCNLEFEFETKINPSTRQNEGTYVKVVNQIGKDTGVIFEYGSNLLKIIYETDYSECYSRAIGLGKGEEVGDGFGRRINLEGVSGSGIGGGMTKITANRFVEYHNTNSTATKIVVFDECTDKKELLLLTAKWLEENWRPKVHFKTEGYNTKTLNIGDRVTVVRHDIDIRYDTRIFKITRDLKDPKQVNYEFGEVQTDTPKQKLKQTIENTSVVSTKNFIAEQGSFVNMNTTQVKAYSADTNQSFSNQFITKISPGKNIDINPIQLVKDFKKINFKINESGDLDIDESSMLNTEILKSATVANDQNEIIGIDYNKIIPWLVAAFQNQNNNKE